MLYKLSIRGAEDDYNHSTILLVGQSSLCCKAARIPGLFMSLNWLMETGISGDYNIHSIGTMMALVGI